MIGLAILVTLVQFAANVIGQLWEAASWVRPATVFFYYQPQAVIAKGKWTTDIGVAMTGRTWGDANVVLVLAAVGAVGYAVAFRRFGRRDLPAPL